MTRSFTRFSLLLLPLALTACGETDTSHFPQARKYEVWNQRGKITGEGGLTLFGGDNKGSRAEDSPLAVNSFIWRATLDTVAFMPLASTDPFGGVIITDWHENAQKPGERFKLTAVILSRELRADAIKVSVFRQEKDDRGQWRDAAVSPSMNEDFENIILSRARELRVNTGS